MPSHVFFMFYFVNDLLTSSRYAYFSLRIAFLSCICTSFYTSMSTFLNNSFFSLKITLTFSVIHGLLLGNTLTCFDVLTNACKRLIHDL